MSALITLLALFFALVVFASIGVGIFGLILGIKNRRIGTSVLSVAIFAIGATGFTFMFFYSTFEKVFSNIV